MAPKIRKKHKLDVAEGTSSVQGPKIRKKRKLDVVRVPSRAQAPRVSRNMASTQHGQQQQECCVDFRSDVEERKYHDDFSHRSIIFSKTVHFQTFASLGIQEMCERINLLGVFQQLSDRCCERAIRLFYANMYAGEKTDSLKTYVYGTELLITPAIVNAIIGFSFEHDADVPYYHGSRECDFIKAGEGLEFLRMIHKNADIETFVRPMSKDLNVKARAIHNMISHTILPRDGHRDLVNYMDMYVMEKLYTSCRFNPGYVILSHMKHISRTSNTSLGYNTLIQKLLDHFHISIPANESLRSERPSDVFNKRHLSQMGIVEVDDNWIFNTRRVKTRLSAPASSSDSIMQKLDIFIQESTTRQRQLENKVEELIISQRDVLEGHRELLRGQRELRQNYLYLSARVFEWIKEHRGEASATAGAKTVDLAHSSPAAVDIAHSPPAAPAPTPAD